MPKEIPSFAVLNRRESMKQTSVKWKENFKAQLRLMFANSVSLNLNRIFLLIAMDDHNVAQVIVALLHKYYFKIFYSSLTATTPCINHMEIALQQPWKTNMP